MAGAKGRRRGRRIAGLLPGAYVVLILAILYIPILVVIIYSFNASQNGINWTGFTLDWYPKLSRNRQILSALRNSLLIGLWSCALAAVIGTLGAVGMARSRLRGLAAMESLSTLPIMVPEIVLGMAFMVFFSLIRLPYGMTTLIIAHTTFCVPYIMIIVRARLVGLDKSYEEAARDLGAGAARAFMTITVPLVMPAIVSGVLLAFAMSLDDVIISFFVTGPETNTLPVYIFGKLKTRITPEINALCALMLAATFLIVSLSQLGRGKADRAGEDAGPHDAA